MNAMRSAMRARIHCACARACAIHVSYSYTYTDIRACQKLVTFAGKLSCSMHMEE